MYGHNSNPPNPFPSNSNYGSNSNSNYGGSGSYYNGAQPNQGSTPVQYNGYGYGQNVGGYGGSNYTPNQYGSSHSAPTMSIMGGGGGGGGGGGFTLTQGTLGSSAVDSHLSSQRKSRPDQTVRPLSLRQVTLATQSLGDAPFVVDGHDIHLITVIAQVKSLVEVATYATIHIHDLSAPFEVRAYLNVGDGNSSDITPESMKARNWLNAAQDGQWIRINGLLKSWSNKRYIVAQSIRPVTDYNEIIMHQLQIIAHHLFSIRGLSPKQLSTTMALKNKSLLPSSQPTYPILTPSNYSTMPPPPTQGYGYPNQPYGQASYHQPPQPQPQPQPQSQSQSVGYGQVHGYHHPSASLPNSNHFPIPNPNANSKSNSNSGGNMIPNYGDPVRNAIMYMLNSPALSGQGAVRSSLIEHINRTLGRNVSSNDITQHLDWLSTEGHVYTGDHPDHFLSCTNA